MIITSIELKNFRNYKELSTYFNKYTNIIYGDNAQGKTNLLEAVYVSGTTKSHKGSKDKDLISFGEEESHIRTHIEKQGVPYQIDMHLKKNKPKGIAINGIPIKRASELFGIVNYILFSPEDLNIIKNGPSERRRFIDMELCQLDKLYLKNLSNYNKVLLQRNKLLKDLYFQPELEATLDIWDMQLASYGSFLIEKRKAFIDRLNTIIAKIHTGLTGGKEQLVLCYENNVTATDFLEKLTRSREKDKKMKMTAVGPHRDDMLFSIKDIDIRKYGSQGQQRTSALSLKLSEIELVKQITNDTPILLLDDVLSELDANRQNYLLNSIHDVQTLITCTGLDEFVKNRFAINKILKVVEGVVTVQN